MIPNIILKATNIDWSIDIEEGLEKLAELSAEDAADAIELPLETYTRMTEEERDDYARSLWRHSPGSLQDFVEAPNEIVIPDPLNPEWTDETIADYITDESGWCVENFKIECNLSKDELAKINGTEHLIGLID